MHSISKSMRKSIPFLFFLFEISKKSRERLSKGMVRSWRERYCLMREKYGCTQLIHLFIVNCRKSIQHGDALHQLSSIRRQDLITVNTDNSRPKEKKPVVYQAYSLACQVTLMAAHPAIEKYPRVVEPLENKQAFTRFYYKYKISRCQKIIPSQESHQQTTVYKQRLEIFPEK